MTAAILITRVVAVCVSSYLAWRVAVEEFFASLWNLIWAGATDQATQLTSVCFAATGLTGLRGLRWLYTSRQAAKKQAVEAILARERQKEEDAKPTAIGCEILAELEHSGRTVTVEGKGGSVIVVPGKLRVATDERYVWVCIGKDNNEAAIWRDYTERVKLWERRDIALAALAAKAALEVALQDVEDAVALETLRRGREEMAGLRVAGGIVTGGKLADNCIKDRSAADSKLAGNDKKGRVIFLGSEVPDKHPTQSPAAKSA